PGPGAVLPRTRRAEGSRDRCRVPDRRERPRHLLLEYHKRLDAASERARGTAKIGTTGKGIGPAYEDKVARRGVRVTDLRDASRAHVRIREAAEAANERLLAAGEEPIDAERVADEVLSG